MQRHLEALRVSLEKSTGISLDTISGCRQVEERLRKLDVQVSYSTLSRMYGLSNHRVKPRIQTLDALCRAIGFEDFENFCNRAPSRPSVLRYQNELLFDMEVLMASNQADEAVDYFIAALKEDRKNCFLSLHLGKYLYAHLDRHQKALKKLAKDELSRQFFYQFYIDEDDLNGSYQVALNQHFLIHANVQERMFARLFTSRKAVMSGSVLEKASLMEYVHWVESTSSLHLKSRAWELLILNEWLRYGEVKRQTLEWVMEKALKCLDVSQFEGEECGMIGRICRAFILTGTCEMPLSNSRWITVCRQVVFGNFSDLEFQSAAQYFLQMGNCLLINERMVYHADWPNAFYTSQLFLQDKKVIAKNQAFFIQKLQIHKRFMFNIINNKK